LYSNVDKLPPFTPIVNEITETSTSVSGIAEAGSTITVKAGTTVIGTSTATTEGKYTVTIERQKAGTVISVTATDSAGNISKVKDVKVSDVTAPPSPIVNEITETSTSVSGSAEAGSTITVKVGTTVIGTSTATTEGKYTVTIERQKAGTVISVTATDEAGNVSELKVTSISVSVEVDLLPQQQENRFPDVTFYKDEITYLTGKKIITGYPDGTFKPKQNLTRLQAVTMILREKGITNFTSPNPNFTDMKPGSYGYEIVAKAVQLGFIGGKTASDGSKFFDPSAPLTRGQMAKILSEGYNLQKTSDVPFIDVSANNGYKDYISTLATENITTGYADGSFKSTVNLSRAHFAVFMARLLDDKFKIVTSTKSES